MQPADDDATLIGRTHRCQGQLRGAAVIGAIVTLVLLVVGGAVPTTIPKVLAFALAAGIAWLSVSAAAAGVRVERDQLVIRGVLRTTRIPWGQLEAFSFGKLDTFPAVGIAQLRDGREIAMTPLLIGRAGSPQAKIEAETIVAELNRARERLARVRPGA